MAVKRGLLLWTLLTASLVAVCAVLIRIDPQGFSPERVWVGTDHRTGLATTYAGKRILGHWALFAGQWDAAHLKTECPNLAGAAMTDQDRNSRDILRIDMDGRLHCVEQGDALRIDDLEVRLVSFSKNWMTFPDPAGGPPIAFGHAELAVHRTDQPYLALGLLVATALVGVALTKVIDAATSRPSAPPVPTVAART